MMQRKKQKNRILLLRDRAQQHDLEEDRIDDLIEQLVHVTQLCRNSQRNSDEKTASTKREAAAAGSKNR